jgi:aminoglycoside phosphotransferase (APT) family kinase protein
MDRPNDKIPFTFEYVLTSLPEAIAKGMAKIHGIDYDDARKQLETRSYELDGLVDHDEEWDEEE